MPSCGYCGSNIIFGGVKAGNQRFCNSKCSGNAYILSVSQTVPPDVLNQKIEEVWRGNCPKCGNPGPIDVHKYHEVWSALVLTRWTTNSQVSCRSCAKKRQAGAMALSLFCGWWGFPWGLILTPVQVTRNIVEMAGGTKADAPSPNLRRIVQVHIGSQMMASQRNVSKASFQPPPIPGSAQPPPVPR
jgi:hypothetical protein